jgi:prolipoprotein diacylglyceryltransferase
VMAILLRVARHWRVQAPGYILALYLALYSLGRFFVEGLRVDPAHEIGPLRLNQVVAAIVFALSLLVLLRLRRQAPSERFPE